MRDAAPRFSRTAAWPVPALLCGWLLGTAAQLQQAALWPWWMYGVLAGLALTALAWLGRPGRRALALAWIAGALLAFGSAGLRSAAFSAEALAPALEGLDLRLRGVIAAMPQQRASGDLRLRLAIETAEH